MTLPRPVVPERFLLISRRCTQRQYLLRPDEATNEAFTYCLGEAAQRFGLDIVLSQMMSNHHHTVLYDPHGVEVEFREHFHKMLAKCQNALRGRWENLWTSTAPSVVELLTREALLDKLVYVATNPVKDGLVDEVYQWPGPNFLSALLSGRTMRAKRPRHFFRDDGDMPAEIELRVGLPEGFKDKEGFLLELARRIAAVEAAHEQARRETGARVFGRRRVLRQSWRESPTTQEPRRVLNPRVASRCESARIAALQRNKQWQRDYREARRAWLAGEDVEFPFGTYWLKRFAGVRVKPPPQPELGN